jgi:HEAT repeat protein
VSGALVPAVAALVAVFGLLLIAIVVGRMRADRRQARERRLRPGIETEIVTYLADPEASPPTPPEGRDSEIVFRKVAMETLLELRGGERERLTQLLEETGIVDHLCAELRARRRLTRLHAAELLAELRSRRAAQDLLLSLLDPDPDVRLACARGLAELAEADFIEPVVNAADWNATDRPGAAAAVMLVLGTETPEALGETLDERRTSALRRLAAAVVGERRLAEYAPQLRAALHSDDDELVARAARGLGRIGDFDAVDDLLVLLDDDDREWFCRVVAASALGAIGDPRAVPALARQLEHGEWLMRDRAAAALGMLGEPGHDVLEHATSSSRAEVRAHAAVALAP